MDYKARLAEVVGDLGAEDCVLVVQGDGVVQLCIPDNGDALTEQGAVLLAASVACTDAPLALQLRERILKAFDELINNGPGEAPEGQVH